MSFIWKNNEIEIKYWDGDVWTNNTSELIDLKTENNVLNVKAVVVEIEILNDIQTEVSRYMYNTDSLPLIGMRFSVNSCIPIEVKVIELKEGGKICIEFENIRANGKM